MKCVGCGKDARKQDRLANSGRCPSCRHPFVADPDTDRVTDGFVQAALERVTGNGAYHFLREHLVHEVSRRLLRRAARRNRIATAVLLVGVAMIGIGILSILLHKPTAGLLLPGLPLAIGAAIYRASESSRNRALDTRSLIDRWLKVNPSNLLVVPGQAARSARATAPAALGSVSFDRVLVAEPANMVDFLLANKFHFHYSCPVLGGNAYPDGVFDDMIRRLRSNPRLEVFVIHDQRPGSQGYAHQIQQSPRWFGGAAIARCIDLGLLPVQDHLLRELSGGGAAELTMLRPESMLRMIARGLDEKQPFHLQSKGAATDSGSSGGYG